ncbi:ras-related GTP-binding protein D isoform X3 [Desmodus rotundus]|uniref:ras-related GTP-binding protein D isoform X3 n=1 Tax=Desmodus rotundus TaxID=9430 RepID=UPI002380D43F|nr:ras-related GTP-binding protein D isoform X3 [Desmodus rotundus]
MSQVLGKPQLEDEDDDEEDELVGLADYGDRPDSSDAEPDSGAEEGVLDFSDPFSTEVKPRILLMGLRRSGKSSIQKVVFHKMSPNETLFLESTNKICREDVSNSSFVNFQIWDFPGQIDFFDPTFDYEMIFRGTGALIFVIDSQDDYMEALARLHLTVTRAYKVNTDINFEVFIHKVDGLSDDHKIETQRDIHQRANDDLADAGLEKIHLSLKEDGAGTPYDKESTAIIKLNNTTVLYLKEVTKFLALVCFVREESFERKERGEGRKKEKERNINVWLPFTCPQQRTWPATQECALTGNRTSDPSACRQASGPLSHTSQGYHEVVKNSLSTKT